MLYSEHAADAEVETVAGTVHALENERVVYAEHDAATAVEECIGTVADRADELVDELVDEQWRPGPGLEPAS